MRRPAPAMPWVVPADHNQVRQATRAIHKVPGPAYMRIGSGRDPVVDSDIPFELGKVRILKEHGTDVAIFEKGFVINRARAALSAEKLPCPVVRVGLRDVYPRSGEPEPLLDYYKMSVTDIVEAAKKAIKTKA